MVTNIFIPTPVESVTQYDEIIYQSPSTKLIVYDIEVGTGTLHVTKSNVTWSSPVSSTPRISLLYPTISFFGIQREPTAALHVVVNYELKAVFPNLALQVATSGTNDDDDLDDQPITHLRFVPQNVTHLEGLHSALNEGQALHPDPGDEVYDEEEGFEAVDVFEDTEDMETQNGMFATPAVMLGRLQIDEHESRGPSIEDNLEDDNEERG